MIKKLFAILLLLFGIGSVCATEQTNYPYYIEDMGNGQYNIWTKVNVSAYSDKVIYIQKQDGNSPDGNSVFEWFDDFDGNSLDTSKWKIAPSVKPTVSNSILSWYHTTDNSQSIRTINTFNNVIITAKLQYNSQSYNALYFGLAGDSDDRLIDISGSIGIIDSTDYNTGQLWYGGSTTDFFTPSSNTWKRYELTKTDTLIKANVNGQTITRDYADNIERHIHLSIKNPNVNAMADYIFVRKYADQEPTVSVEQVDSNTWKITISNPNNQDLTDFQVKINGNGIVSSKTDSLLLTDNIDPQYIILSAPDIWNINTPVNATVSGYNIPQGTIIYLDWGDGVIDNQIYNGEELQFQHTYTETGTYHIKSYVNIYIITEKQIIITENLTTGTLHFKPLYENTTITGWAIVNGMNVSMAKNATIYGVAGSPLKIQTSQGYMTSIPFSTNMTAYIAGNEYQYVTVSLSADTPIIVKNGDKIVGYGKNIFITQPVGDTITVWCNNKKIREYILRSSIDDYIYIPKQHITANIKENNGILAVYLETWRKEKLHIEIKKDDNIIYQTEGYYEGFQRIDTGIIPEAGKTYTLRILNEDGNVVSYSTYTYTSETEKPNIPEQEGYIWIAFIIGVIIMIMGVISDNLPIALIGVGLFVLLVPYHMPYLDHLAAISTALAIIIIISRHIKRNAGD